ncbi:hypothetical protein [Cerasicoccus fimbriatus]|uniref:hypothetical protein n=1 Tax=Cerasicoccus fimbriatus TaxID=3014554 RepID=UPI0022B2D2A6|nr:hypothetical protein [Cerasicoccus sp. TK19100]
MFSFFRQKDLSKDDFAEMMRKRFNQAVGSDCFRYNQKDFTLNDGKDRSVFLGNIYGHYLQSKGAERKAQLDRFVQGVAQAGANEMPERFEDAKENIIPVVRERMMFEGIKLRSKFQDAKQVAFENWVGNLCLALVYDSPNAMAMINQEQLANWGMNYEEGLSLARNNLGLLTKPQFISPTEGVYIAAWDDDYDSSRLLLTHLWNTLDVAGDVVVICANRNRVFATGDESTEGLRAILAFTQKALQEPRAMRPQAMVLRNGQWSLFEYSGEDAELRANFELLHLQTQAGEYEEQKAMLDAKFEEEGTDLFVASFYASRNQETGELMNYCVWTMGIECLLPKSTQVAVVDPELGQEKGMLGMTTWEALVEDPGVSFQQHESHYPPRFIPSGRPTDAFLANLAK